MQQTSECVGKLNVEDINADRLSLAVRSPQPYLDRRDRISNSADLDALPILSALVKFANQLSCRKLREVDPG